MAAGLAHAAGEHVVPPDQGADAGDGDAGEGDELVAEDGPAGEDRDDLGDHPHRREDHDVDRRVASRSRRGAGTGADRRPWPGRRAPMPKSRSAMTSSRVMARIGRRQDLHPGGGVERPDEERHAAQAHPRRPQAVDGGDEVEPGEDRREAEDEDAEDRQRDVGAGPEAVGDVEGPAGVGRAAAGEERREHDDGAGRCRATRRGGSAAGRPRRGRRSGCGRMKLPKDRRMPGMMKRKIMITPWSVKRAL